MGIETVVNVVIRAGVPPISRLGFDTPLILGTTARAGTDRIRFYTSAAAVSAADYAVDTWEYKMAARIFSQTRRPARIAIGKRLTLPTQAFTLTPLAGNALTYAFRVGDSVVSFTGDSTGTVAEAATGLAAAFTGLTSPPTIVTVTATSTTVLVVSTAAGTFVPLEVLTPDTLSVVQDQVDAGVATDLAAFAQASPDWYGILTPFTSQAEVLAIATWAEANTKDFFWSTVDSAPLNATYAPATPDTDVGGATRSRNLRRNLGFAELATDEFLAAAAMGRFFGATPGSTVLANKRLVGVRALPLSDTQQTNLRARNMNPYVAFSDAATILYGTQADGTFADYLRDGDNFVRRTQEDVFIFFQDTEKPPFTDVGGSMLENVVRGRAELETTSGFLASWDVTTTPVADLDPADVEERRFGGVTLTAYRAGAIQSADPITVTFLS